MPDHLRHAAPCYHPDPNMIRTVDLRVRWLEDRAERILEQLAGVDELAYLLGECYPNASWVGGTTQPSS